MLRDHPNHKERGPAKFYFTYEDIAAATGLSVATVRKKKSHGELDPKDFLSVLRFCQRYMV